MAANDGLHGFELRARARVEAFRPVTPRDRLAAFQEQGFRPSGLFMPSDEALRAKVKDLLVRIGADPNVDSRLSRYEDLQKRTALLEGNAAGRWIGQQAVARSPARFRLVAWGRRSGKTSLAANEAIAVLRSRPRSVVWVCAPLMVHVSRCFDMIVTLLDDLGEKPTTFRNGAQHKLLILESGSRVEGISMENFLSAAGAAVDFVIVDEAAQITEDAWQRAILPPLADRNGHALLISSWEGENNFFHQQAMRAEAERATKGAESDWDFFQDESWNVNFHMFPQGRQSPSILAMERQMDPIDFLEQFGAIPAKAKGRVFSEFREKVHVGEYKFNPDHPVILACDPSGGAGPYAVLVLQDYKDYAVQIDEFYQAGMTAESIAPLLEKRDWRKNVTDMVVDSAWPVEVERWVRLGWPAFPVPEKPQVHDRLPLMSNLLRDPNRYHFFYRRAMNELLVEMGLAPDADFLMSPEQQRSLLIQLEDRLSDKNMSDADLRGLRHCARFFVDRGCAWTIQEFKLYAFTKPRIRAAQPRNVKENPHDAHNHAMDAWGYFTWVWHRAKGDTQDWGIKPLIESPETARWRAVELPRPTPIHRSRSFLREMRETHALPGNERRQSILTTVS